MGRKRERSAITANSMICQGTTLREQNTGPKIVDVGSILKAKHLQRLATWTSSEAQITPLAAFFGERLSAKSEASGIPLSPTNFHCHRCEMMLHPGMNCTVRIEKNIKRMKRGKKSLRNCQNNLVYTCHFCEHRNLKWGTSKGHLKSLLSSRPSHTSKSGPYNAYNERKDNYCSTNKELAVGGEPSSVERCAPFKKDRTAVSNASSMTPLSILDNKPDKKRNAGDTSANKLPAGGESSATSNTGNRRRKKWTSLREVAENNELNRRITNPAIPFLL